MLTFLFQNNLTVYPESQASFLKGASEFKTKVVCSKSNVDFSCVVHYLGQIIYLEQSHIIQY